MTADIEAMLVDLLASAKKVRLAAIHAERKIYWGNEPCEMQCKNPAFKAACKATIAATAHCNVIIDHLNALREKEKTHEPEEKARNNYE
jgi:hypothetical protein